MSNPTSKKTTRKLRLTMQTVHTTSPSSGGSPTATCVGCATSDCLTLFVRDQH